MRGYLWVVTIGYMLAGIISLANIIVGKKPELKDKMDMLLSYSGYIGTAVLLAGLWGFIDGLFFTKFYTTSLGPMMKMIPVEGLAILIFPPLGVIFGLLLGLPKIAEWTGKDLSKVEGFAKKLAPYQVPFGIVALVDGFLLFLFRIHVFF
ncbi:MAG: hypothetical protein J7M25_18645 [Deltaproteobacteria bacterium]|nr:hypothetical protein [Deltaproteobacteria bacterium]